MTVPAVGSAAPAFELRDQHGAPVRLTDLGDAPALVLFYPYAFSSVCSNELHRLRDGLRGRTVRAVAISCDSMFTLRAFSEMEGLEELTLLADHWPHGEVARAYGAFDAERGCATRASFVIDAHGIVRRRIDGEISAPRDLSAHWRAVDDLAAA